MKHISSPGLMPETGRSGPGHWDDPEGWAGEGGGRGGKGGGSHVHLRLIHVSSVQSLSHVQLFVTP